jgi:hypothetical protein
VFVRRDADIGAASNSDFLSWGRFLIVFVCFEGGERLAGAIGVEMRPYPSNCVGVDGGRKEEESSKRGMHGCQGFRSLDKMLFVLKELSRQCLIVAWMSS